MSNILVFTENANGKLKRSSCELLTAAKKSGLNVVAICFGTQATSAGQEAGKFGATECVLVKDAAYDQYNPELFTSALTEVFQKYPSKIILASASSLGKDLLPRFAARVSAGVISDATELKISGENVEVKKPMYSGKAIANMTFDSSAIKIVLMRANQLPVEEFGGSAKLTELSVSKPNLSTLIKEVVKGTSEKLDLTEANIIVSGGRGLKEASNFKMLEDLASVLGATVGASRAVVDAGWVSHGMQVGQTGKTVAPSLYIAVGISGAIQHLAGMSSSKVIVAINNDANAPIFQKATYGIVGDAFDIVPKLTAEFKKVLQQ
jgi:electron transfer flavoprotein alpha subunit